jgi:hypothetical protein
VAIPDATNSLLVLTTRTASDYFAAVTGAAVDASSSGFSRLGHFIPPCRHAV